MTRYRRKQPDNDLLNKLYAIIIIIGFIILLAKSLIIPVLVISIILLVVGYYFENEKGLFFGILGLLITIILLIIGHSFGESEIGIMCQDAFRNFYNATQIK